MVSILDLKRRYKDVPTSIGEVRMWSVSISALTHLIGAFPLLKKLIDGKASEDDFSVESLIGLAPNFAAQVIAAGADEAGNPDAIEAAAGAPIGDQVALLAGVLEASMPKGAAPFLEALKKLAGVFSDTGGKAPLSASPKRSKP